MPLLPNPVDVVLTVMLPVIVALPELNVNEPLITAQFPVSRHTQIMFWVYVAGGLLTGQFQVPVKSKTLPFCVTEKPPSKSADSIAACPEFAGKKEIDAMIMIV